MAEKELKARIVHKHDTEANWNKATNFIPKESEFIVYDMDDTHNYFRLKNLCRLSVLANVEIFLISEKSFHPSLILRLSGENRKECYVRRIAPEFL